MRIGIYADAALKAQPSGIGFHVRHLLNELPPLAPADQFYFYYPRGLFSDRNLQGAIPGAANVTARGVRCPSGWSDARPRIWWHHLLPAAVRRDRLDVFHGPNHFLPVESGPRQVLTVHDLAFLKMDLYPAAVTAMMKHWLFASLARADSVIAISDHTRTDLLECGVPAERIRVVHNGARILRDDEIAAHRAAELRAEYALPEHYILYMSTLAKRKNVPLLLEAFARLKRRTQLPHSLVLAGRPGTGSDDIKSAIDRLELGSQVILTGYLDDWKVPLLYKMAGLFVLPTLYEGFTIVTLEAMGYGVPVITTNSSSNAENVGDAGLLVEPGDIDGLAETMARVLEDDTLRRELIARGKRRAAQFTWTNTAQHTLRVYRDLARQYGRTA